MNSQLIAMYWELGQEIVERQEQHKWGSDFINQLSKDLSKAFPEMKGFSRANLYRIKKFFLFYNGDDQIVAQAARQFGHHVDIKVQQLVEQIPWWHNIVIIEKIQDVGQALWYIHQTIENGWSRNVLAMQIESGLYNRQARNQKGKVTNFSKLLPDNQSDLAENTLKDPYLFDFLNLGNDAHERELEDKLITHIRDFLLELGQGFAFIGNQYHLEVGGDDFYIDMLLYHVKLHCYVVVELKTTKFQPEYAGKLNFYLSVVDDLVKGPEDNPTIGILLCKDKNKLVAEYSLRDLNKPMGISEYQLSEALTEELETSLLSVEEMEEELENEG